MGRNRNKHEQVASQSWGLRVQHLTARVGRVPRLSLGAYTISLWGNHSSSLSIYWDLEVWFGEEALAWYEYGLGLNFSKQPLSK